MFSSLHIRGFQSLYEVDVKLSPFTVLVGPSNSGKSAVVRALYTLVTNPRTVGDIISDGQSTTIIKLLRGEDSIVYQRDGKGTKYQLNGAVYTKLAGTVPDEVSSALGISDLAFSSQFAMPFLLDESGAVVARRFGTLTNVTTIFEAAREGNRRRGSCRTSLKTREFDLSKLKEKLVDYSGLKDKLGNQERAESLLSEALTLNSAFMRLEVLHRDMTAANETLLHTPQHDFTVPDLGELEALLVRVHALESLLFEAPAKAKAAKDAKKESARLIQEKSDHENSYEVALVKMGTCPTCNQRTDRDTEATS